MNFTLTLLHCNITLFQFICHGVWVAITQCSFVGVSDVLFVRLLHLCVYCIWCLLVILCGCDIMVIYCQTESNLYTKAVMQGNYI